MKKRKPCPHIGVLHPKNFDCFECNDNAENCNCHDCMGVFCNECNDDVWTFGKDNKLHTANCEDVRQAWQNRKCLV